MKKRLLALAMTAVMLGTMSLAGCGGSANGEPQESGTESTGSSEGESEGEGIHLVLYFPVNVGGDVAKLVEQLCDDFHEENPDIEVEAVYTGNYDDTVTKIQTAIQGGTPPDLFVNLATQRFTMASTGMAMPLDDLIEADGEEGEAYISDFLEGFMEDSYVDG